MIVCKHCGKELEDVFKFCLGCGATLSAPTQPSPTEEGSDMPVIEVALEPLALQEPSLNGVQVDFNAQDEVQDDEDYEDDDESDYEDEEDQELGETAESSKVQSTGFIKDKESSEDTDDLMDAWAQDSSFKSVLSPSHSERLCSKCGAQVTLGYKFCGQCGSRFDEPSEPTRADLRKSSSFRIDRVSFINDNIDNISTSANNARFSLSHVNEDGSLGQTIPLVEGENIIGRSSSPSLASDPFVSPRHFVLHCNHDVAEIDPRGSLNGVFLRLLSHRVALVDAMIFRIGEELIQFIAANSSQSIIKATDNEATQLVGSCETPGWGYLRIILGAYAEGNVYRLSKNRIEIGRTRGDITFERDGFVSGTHVAILNENGAFFLEDVGSSNGTFVRLSESTKIKKATHLLVGNQLLLLKPLVS